MTIVTLAEERTEKLFEQFEQFYNDGDGYLTRRQSDPCRARSSRIETSASGPVA
ncbi:hypothetical protein [Nonomuraea sp. NPDC049625]|uniref:hypothetical protein n=1 Tax=Nonomuraea sp. NPDC049625 TaxID=3155775 RepID=UPI003448FBAA